MPTAAKIEGVYKGIDRDSGKYCFGKTPMQTFLDSKKLSDEKQLGRTDRTAAENPVAA